MPLVKFTFTIIGSILGVIPTATDKANSIASNQSFLIKPYITKTATETTSMYLISIFVILFIPFSKFVGSFLVSTSLLILPKYVVKPVSITTPVALPLTTLEPIKQIFGIENISFASLVFCATFSTGTLSPVKTDWFTNKSLLSISIMSAGIIEPALKCTISPGTTFSTLISFSFPPLTTLVVVYILAFNSWLNLYTL